jgi:hypothetical protein
MMWTGMAARVEGVAEGGAYAASCDLAKAGRSVT